MGFQISLLVLVLFSPFLVIMFSSDKTNNVIKGNRRNLETSLSSSAASSLNRTSFPQGFLFGTSSSSYQFEGAANEGGRGPSIWDTFVQRYPQKIKDQSSGVRAVDSYHRYKEDVGLMKNIGFHSYRFSISWSRLLPNGTRSDGVNRNGIEYYNNLINELFSNGMEPFVTLTTRNIKVADA